ncbi:hypothetical protein C8J57DRAFT_1214191 [Mycena rebaudengoi]|nr:hypothetical protein C8J57DRAFT_1214191 [Mycena rebaudengoi]
MLRVGHTGIFTASSEPSVVRIKLENIHAADPRENTVDGAESYSEWINGDPYEHTNEKLGVSPVPGLRALESANGKSNINYEDFAREWNRSADAKDRYYITTELLKTWQKSSNIGASQELILDKLAVKLQRWIFDPFPDLGEPTPETNNNPDIQVPQISLGHDTAIAQSLSSPTILAIIIWSRPPPQEISHSSGRVRARRAGADSTANVPAPPVDSPAPVLGVRPVLNTPTSAEMHRTSPVSGSGSRSALDLAATCRASTRKRMQAESSAVPSISSNKRHLNHRDILPWQFRALRFLASAPDKNLGGVFSGARVSLFLCPLSPRFSMPYSVRRQLFLQFKSPPGSYCEILVNMIASPIRVMTDQPIRPLIDFLNQLSPICLSSVKSQVVTLRNGGSWSRDELLYMLRHRCSAADRMAIAGINWPLRDRVAIGLLNGAT